MPPNYPAAQDPSTATATRETGQTEDIFLRNYDTYRGYDLTVTVSDQSGRTVFENTFYFQPGGTESVRDTLAPGEYQVTAELDNSRRKSATCRVGAAGAETIHVELGNGIVSITQGLFS